MQQRLFARPARSGTRSAERADAMQAQRSRPRLDPTVTVLIPVFNRPDFVSDAIRSVLEQDFQDLELLVVDDGSTDRTADVLASWRLRDPRVTIVSSSTNQGIPGALNLGLAHARGTYIARLDSDDLMLPRRLAEQATVLDTRPDVILVSCWYDIVNSDGSWLGTWKSDHPHEVTKFLLRFYNIIGGGGQVMFRRDDVLREGGYATAYPSSEDYDLWARLLRRGRIETLPFVGMTKRTHDQQSLTRYAGVKRANWSAIMRSSLESYLQRAVTDVEIAALIKVWRHDGERGLGPVASAIMREAYERFRGEVGDRRMQRLVRHLIARQWLTAARVSASRGQLLESARLGSRALQWL